MRSKFYHTIVLLFLVFLSACSNELVYNNIVRVNYGTSFGECVGFCQKQLSITSDSIHYTAFCNSCMTPMTARKDLYLTPTKEYWDSIRTNIPLNSFFNLASVIGCPDCADGGAEWLEIFLNNGKKHKVTFEYNNEPKELKQYILTLRLLLNKESL